MTTVFLISGILLFTSGLAILAAVLIRRSILSDRQMDAEFERRSRRIRAKMSAALTAEREAVEGMKDLPWPELRRRHEEASGKPCKCATRREAARAIYFAERKLQNER